MALDRQKRTKVLLTGAVTVAVLAAVLIVAGLFGPLRSGTSGPGSTSIDESQQLYQQALVAQASGDTSQAAVLAQQAVDANPENASAKALLAQVKKPATTPTTNPGTNTGTDTDADTGAETSPTVDVDAAFRKNYEDLKVLVPAMAAGFVLDTPLQMERDLNMSGNVDPANKTITQVSWAVHDFKTESKAKAFVTKTSKKSFPKDSGTVSVGTTKAYFGTDGTRFATVSFARGRYAFEVLVTTANTDPIKAKDIAIAAAKAFPASPAQ